MTCRSATNLCCPAFRPPTQDIVSILFKELLITKQQQQQDVQTSVPPTQDVVSFKEQLTHLITKQQQQQQEHRTSFGKFTTTRRITDKGSHQIATTGPQLQQLCIEKKPQQELQQKNGQQQPSNPAQTTIKQSTKKKSNVTSNMWLWRLHTRRQITYYHGEIWKPKLSILWLWDGLDASLARSDGRWFWRVRLSDTWLPGNGSWWSENYMPKRIPADGRSRPWQRR